MSRGTTLTNLLLMLKAELGDSLSVGTQADATYKLLLANKQKFLVGEYSFPYMDAEWTVNLTAGTKLYTFPTTDVNGATVSMDFERPLVTHSRWNSLWECVDYGIGVGEYNYQDSEAVPVETLDPVRKWRHVSLTQFEVWPVPSTATASGFRFTGQRALGALASGSDTALIDDELLVLSVAVPLLAKRKSADAQVKSSEAGRRLLRLMANYPTRNSPIVFGQQQLDDRKQYRQAKLVVVA